MAVKVHVAAGEKTLCGRHRTVAVRQVPRQAYANEYQVPPSYREADGSVPWCGMCARILGGRKS